MQKKFQKLICSSLSLAAICGGMVGLTGCGNEESKSKEVALCAPKTNKDGTDTYEFVLGKDGKTIEHFTVREHVDVDYFKSIVDNPSQDELISLYAQYYYKYLDQYKAWVSNNSKVTWIKANLTNSDDMQATFTITFDFTDENFKTDKATLNYLSSFMPTKLFYNEDEQRMEYVDGIIDGAYKKEGINMSCKTTTKKASETMYYKLLSKINEINKSKSDSKK